MKLTIEFIRNRSPYFNRVLSLCRKIKTFREETSPEGLTVYAVDFDENEIFSAEAVRDYVYGWKGTAFYLDGRLVSKSTGWRMIYDAAHDTLIRYLRSRPETLGQGRGGFIPPNIGRGTVPRGVRAWNQHGQGDFQGPSRN